MKNKTQFLILIILLYQLVTGNKLKCGSDLLKRKKPTIINDISNKRKLDDDNFEPIRIKVDYTQLKIDTETYPDIFSKIKESLDAAINYFQLLISVKRSTIQPINHMTFEHYCSISNIDEDVSTWINDYDLILFPSFDYDNPTPNVYASAYPCLLLDSSKRPFAGKINIENNFDFKKNNIKIFLQTVLFHEISHVFIFDQNLFGHINAVKKVQRNGETISIINTPKVLEKARLHFNCENLEGIPLENQGGDGSAGSHWESRYMLGDYMVSNNYLENAISDITLALFEDSGWYKVNYYTGGLFRFGKDEGCDFFQKKCIVNKENMFPNEFCTEKKEPKCTNSHLGMGECYIMEYEDNEIPKEYQYFKDENLGGLFNTEFCPVADLYYNKNTKSYFENSCKYGDSLNIFNHYGEVIGNNSICFESSLVPRYSPQPYKWRSICYPISCDRKNKNIIVYVNDLSVVCPNQGGKLTKIKGFKGKINCPKYNFICTSDIWCSDMFECIDKKSITDENSFSAKNRNNEL